MQDRRAVMPALAVARRLLLSSRQSCMAVLASGIPRGVVGTRRREADRTLRSIAVLEQALDRIEAVPELRGRVDDEALVSKAAALEERTRHLAVSASAGAGAGDRRLPMIGAAQPGGERPASAPPPVPFRPPRPPGIPGRVSGRPPSFGGEPREPVERHRPLRPPKPPAFPRLPQRPQDAPLPPVPRGGAQPPGPKMPLRRPSEPTEAPGRPTIFAQRNSALGRGAAPGDLAERLARSAVAFLSSGGSQRWP